MKKMVIIGAGIAGLTCGIYARMNGLETEIYERHTIPGGECTGWDRGEYHFDGCIHWLTGSKPGTSLYDLWRTTGALNDSVRIVNHEVFVRYEEDGRVVNLYTDAGKLQQHLIEISPQDEGEIKKLCKALKAMGEFGMPIERPMDKMTAGDGIKFMAKNMGKLGMLSRFNKITMKEYAGLFKEPLLQRALMAAIPGDYKANALVMSMAGMNVGDCGYPVGGSRALAKRMEQRYLSLGGKVFYKSRVENIIVKDGAAVGIKLADGREVRSDYIISCADGYATLYKMLGNKYTPQVYRNLYEHPEQHYLPTCAIVFMGVDCELGESYRAINIRREHPVSIGGVDTDIAMLLSYAYDETTAPKGKTVMACYYQGNYDYWNALYPDKEKYAQEKEKLKADAIAVLTARYPQAAGKIEATDVVTPMTYVRYCDAWRGAWMSWGEGGKDIPQYFPGEFPGLSNFIMAGMWTLPPGGLPGAAASGKFAAQRICMKEGIAFSQE